MLGTGKESNLKSSSTSSSSKFQEEGNLHRTESVGSAIGKKCGRRTCKVLNDQICFGKKELN